MAAIMRVPELVSVSFSVSYSGTPAIGDSIITTVKTNGITSVAMYYNGSWVVSNGIILKSSENNTISFLAQGFAGAYAAYIPGPNH
jgi:hypothetical protein